MKHLTLLVSFFLFSDHLIAKNLTVRIKNIQKGTGTLKIGLFKDEATWLKKGESVHNVRHTALPGEHEVTLIFEDLDQEFYAIAIHHDENDNDQMDFKIFPPGPREGYAFSNFGKLGLSRPKWTSCKAELYDDDMIEMELIYP